MQDMSYITLGQQGQHTMRHASGASNSTWSDMFIESTFMKYGHSQGGTLTMSIPHKAPWPYWYLNDNAIKR